MVEIQNTIYGKCFHVLRRRISLIVVMGGGLMSKPFWRSKTLWLNGIVALVAALEASTGLLKPYVGQDGYVALMFLLPAANAMLRFISTGKLTK